MNASERLKEVILIGKTMRKSQQKYFKWRLKEDLEKAKEWEKLFDQQLNVAQIEIDNAEPELPFG